MPKLYNAQTHELFHLSDIWMEKDQTAQSSKLIDDIITANTAVHISDRENIDIWTDFFTQVSTFADTFTEQNPHAADASREVILRRISDLEVTEESFQDYIHGTKTHFYFQAQLFNYLAEGYEYAGISEKAQEYTTRLLEHLPKPHLDILLMRIDALNQYVADLRLQYGKPRDNLNPAGVSAFNDAKRLALDIFSLLRENSISLYDPQKISLIYVKLARGFRKLDLLDESLRCARVAYNNQRSSNVRLNNLAIILQKHGTKESLYEAIGLLQVQLRSDLRASHKRFVTPYYLTYVLCQRAHHFIVDNDTYSAIDYLKRAKESALHATNAIEGYTDSNYAIKARLRLELIKTYQNQLIKVVNESLQLPLQSVEVNWEEANSQDKPAIPARRQQAMQAKHTFFTSLEPAEVKDRVVDFTNGTIGL